MSLGMARFGARLTALLGVLLLLGGCAAQIRDYEGREPVLDAYAEAMRAGYRFYSYGDAMLIL